MPFLGKKTGGRDSDALMWAGDVYRPSGVDGTVAVPASLLQGQRRLCGSAECAGGWTVPWRNRRRPVFEGQWGCSGRCVLSMARAAVRREKRDGAEPEVVAPHRHRVPLGLVMLAQGWITHPQLRKALDAQRESGTGRIGDWLMAECGLEPEQITRGLSVQWGCPVLRMDGFSAEAMALVMPRLFVEEFGLLPLRVAGSRILYLAFENRLDASAAFAVEQMVELKVESGLVDGAQFQAARSRLLECRGVEMKREAIADADSLAARVTAILEQKHPVASRLVRVHGYYWLRLWLENGTTTGRAGTLPVSAEDMSDYVFSIGVEA